MMTSCSRLQCWILPLGAMIGPLSGVAIAGPFSDPIARGGAGAIQGSSGGGLIAFIAVGALLYGGISLIANLGILVGGLLSMDKHQIVQGALGLWRTVLVLAVVAGVVLGGAMAIAWLGSLFRH